MKGLYSQIAKILGLEKLISILSAGTVHGEGYKNAQKEGQGSSRPWRSCFGEIIKESLQNPWTGNLFLLYFYLFSSKL